MTWLRVEGDSGSGLLDPRQVVKVLETRHFPLPAKAANMAGIIPFEKGWVPVLSPEALPWGNAGGGLFVVLDYDGIRIASRAGRITPEADSESEEILDLSRLYKDNGLL